MPLDRTGLLRELNGDVWHPLRAAYAAHDADAFLALHLPDLIRASGTNHTVSGLASYATSVRSWFAGLAARRDAAEITFRFTERLVQDDVASERGVFRIVVQPIGADRLVLYGRFHTLTRRSGAGWRIAADYDTDERGSVGPADFDAARGVDDLS
jgi:ketosteroid isomerase-like protein